MSFAYDSVRQCSKMLKQLDAWLDKAQAHAEDKSFDTSVLVQARLAPDQYPLVRQVQSACDAAKFAAARVTGKEAPAHPDTETTFEQLHARIKAATAYLDTFKEADFQGAEERHVSLPWLEGKYLMGSDYITEAVLPNFYFHLSHAYAILRHNGVALGKMDYIGSLSTHVS